MVGEGSEALARGPVDPVDPVAPVGPVSPLGRLHGPEGHSV